MLSHIYVRRSCVLVCRDTWPSSLRDMAGGCLGFLSERYANLSLFPALELPDEVMAMWPLQVD